MSKRALHSGIGIVLAEFLAGLRFSQSSPAKPRTNCPRWRCRRRRRRDRRQGPEAGVWVIAETTDLPTKFVKIVVTDDQGRFLVPDLPKANYDVWVRGYGLVDSPKIKAAPGKIVDLKAVAGARQEGRGRSTTRRCTGSR